jgi:hypothetical protein
MGFMGLASFYEVDGASDFAHSISSCVEDLIKKELKYEGNEYNPPGVINVLLVLEEYPSLFDLIETSSLRDAIEKKIEFEARLWESADPELRKGVERLRKFFKRKMGK